MVLMQKTLLTILSIFLLVFLYTKLAGPIPFSVQSVQTNKTNLFSMQGTGKATAIPDTALLNFGVSKTASSVILAQEQSNTAINKIIQDLKNLGIKETDIKTTNYSVYPNYDYSTGKQTINGYVVTQNLEVKAKPFDKVNTVIDTVTKDGANLVSGISFVLDDKVKKDLEQKARKEAVGNAKEKAEQLASAAGIRLGRIIDVQENQSPRFEPSPLAIGGLQKEDEIRQTSISPGESTVEITVIIFYEVL